ncbi:MAG: hypothetical protein J6Y35_07120 [Bacteroidales bacterium]|nr:hypothetical protein [Bacteroidales bacterium]
MRIVDEIYKSVYDAVMEEIELPDGWIMSKKEDCTDARSILIHFLYKSGLTRSQIEAKTGLSKTAVRQHINNFSQRNNSNKIMKMHSNNIERKLGAKNLKTVHHQ